MPHLTVEYTSNLKPHDDIAGLLPKLARCLIGQREGGKPVYPPGGVRVRAYEVIDFCIADGSTDAGFVNATLKIGGGRSREAVRATGDALFEVLKAHFATLYERRGLALSLYIDEVNEGGSWKHNNLHARLAGRERSAE
jgi:5-carboxymethyl-2-hydroxymuconate isomerase